MSTIQEALRQVQELKNKIVEKQRFKGYSGRARAISGTLALGGATFFASNYWPQTERGHLMGWGIVFFLSCVLNFGAILYWFLRDGRKDIRRLRPLIDTIPPLLVGGILTLGLVQAELWSWLFPVWMCLFGLANLASRHVLPRAISVVGWFYIIAGALMLLVAPAPFTNPWPMGIIFFAGEWMGGIVLHFDEGKTIAEFFYTPDKLHVKKAIRSVE